MVEGWIYMIMGLPLKPFLELSRRQQRRRIRALLQIDNNSLYLANNIVSTNPIHSSCSLSIAPDPILNVVSHENGYFFDNLDLESFNDAENLNAPVDERSIALPDKDDVQVEVQAQPSSLSSYVEIQTQATVNHLTDFRAFLAHWAKTKYLNLL